MIGLSILTVAVVAVTMPKVEPTPISTDIDRELDMVRTYTNKQPSHDVYALVDNDDEARYVGRTSQTIPVRFEQHLNSGKGVGLKPKTIVASSEKSLAKGSGTWVKM